MTEKEVDHEIVSAIKADISKFMMAHEHRGHILEAVTAMSELIGTSLGLLRVKRGLDLEIAIQNVLLSISDGMNLAGITMEIIDAKTTDYPLDS